jgi:hypothetical protein
MGDPCRQQPARRQVARPCLTPPAPIFDSFTTALVRYRRPNLAVIRIQSGRFHCVLFFRPASSFASARQQPALFVCQSTSYLRGKCLRNSPSLLARTSLGEEKKESVRACGFHKFVMLNEFFASLQELSPSTRNEGLILMRNNEVASSPPPQSLSLWCIVGLFFIFLFKLRHESA